MDFSGICKRVVGWALGLGNAVFFWGVDGE